MALSASGLGVQGDQLILTVRRPFDVLFTEAIEKDLRTLAKSLELKPVFTAAPDSAVHPTGKVYPAMRAGKPAPAL